MTLSPEMAARLAAPATTLCHAWRVTLADGSRLGFTDHDRALRLDDLDCEPQSGVTATEARDSAGLATDSTEIGGALSSDRIREADLIAGRYDRAVIETFLVDWAEPAFHVVIRTATIGKVRFTDGAFTAELESRSRDFDQPRGRHFRRGCDAELGDARCGVDLSAAPYRGEGAVVSVGAAGALTVSGLDDFAEGWFANGLLQVGAGPPVRIAGHRRSATAVLLDPALAVAVAPGAAFVATAGCDKRFATCRTRFANSLNFRGFPHLPGNDAAYGYATEDAVFDGAPLVP